MKEVKIHQVMPLFEFIQYKQGEANISYKLNNTLMKYLLEQKEILHSSNLAIFKI